MIVSIQATTPWPFKAHGCVQLWGPQGFGQHQWLQLFFIYLNKFFNGGYTQLDGSQYLFWPFSPGVYQQRMTASVAQNCKVSNRRVTVFPSLRARSLDKIYYALVEDPALQILCLPNSARGLGGHQFSFVSRLDVTFPSSKMKEMKVSLKSLAEMISWLDLWMITVWSLANSTQGEDVVKVHCLLNTGGKAMVHMENAVTVN